MILLLLMAGTPACERGFLTGLPAAGSDPIVDTGMLESHSEALVRWAAMGIRNAVVINFDAHDDFRVIPDETVRALRTAYESGDNNALAAGDSFKGGDLYNVGNFLYAAARLGIVDELYWVIPYSHFSAPKREERLRRFLLHSSFSPADLESFSMRGGCFRGLRGGMRINVCGMEALPLVTGPVLLSIDADYFAPLVFEYRADHLTALRGTMRAIAEGGYRVHDSVVSYSVSGGYTRPMHLWVGDAVARLLGEPGLIAGAETPEDWAMLQRLELKRRAGKFSDVTDAIGKRLRLVAEAGDGGGGQPELQAYAADAYRAQGQLDNAFRASGAACRADSLHCYIFPYIGGRLLKQQDIKNAASFFERGFELNPDMNLNILDYAMALRGAGRLDKALMYIAKHQKYFGRDTSDFVAGEIYLMKGDEGRAIEHFDIASVYLRDSIYGGINRTGEAVAALKAADLYDSRGRHEMALWLRRHPGVNKRLKNTGSPR